MRMPEAVLIGSGAFAFGIVVGWLTYFILRRSKPTALSDLSTVVATLGGATILGLFDPKGPMFGAYAIGLAVGFFGYYFAFTKLVGVRAIRETLTRTKDDEGTILE